MRSSSSIDIDAMDIIDTIDIIDIRCAMMEELCCVYPTIMSYVSTLLVGMHSWGIWMRNIYTDIVYVL